MTFNEIQEIQFETGMRGYKCDQVDKFIDDVSIFIKELIAQNDDLLYKIQILADKIEEYKKDEESIREALLGAQKLGSTVLAEAKQKSETMLREATNSSEEMISQAKVRAEFLVKDSVQKAATETNAIKKATENEQRNLEQMKKEVSAFKTTILNLYKSHLELLSNIPEVTTKNNKFEKMTQEAEDNQSKDEQSKVSEDANNQHEQNLINESMDQTKEFEQGAPTQTDQENKTDYSWKFGELKFGANKEKK